MIGRPQLGHGLRHAALAACLLGLLVAPATPLSASPSRSAGLQLFAMPEAHLSPVLQLIRGAHRSIRLEVYLLTDSSIVRELERARQRGVDVRVLLEEHPFKGGRYARQAYSRLQQAGASVRWANEGEFSYTHEKALAVDDRVAGIFTFNLTGSGLRRNREFGLVDTTVADVRALETIFDADWARQQPTYRDIARLVVSPYNARRVLSDLIDGARHMLDVYAEEVGDASIEAHLGRAVRRGVRVRLITSATSRGVETLRRVRVAVKLVTHPYIHAKAVVADGVNVFVGSENLSSTSLDRNREMGVATRDLGVAAAIENTFSHDWQGAPAPTPSPARAPARTGNGALFVRVSTSPTVVHRGDLLTVRARTLPGAACGVRVTYPDGYVSRARSLSRIRSAPGGNVTWSLRVGSHVLGTGEARVTCAAAGLQVSSGATFTIE